MKNVWFAILLALTIFAIGCAGEKGEPGEIVFVENDDDTSDDDNDEGNDDADDDLNDDADDDDVDDDDGWADECESACTAIFVCWNQEFYLSSGCGHSGSHPECTLSILFPYRGCFTTYQECVAGCTDRLNSGFFYPEDLCMATEIESGLECGGVMGNSSEDDPDMYKGTLIYQAYWCGCPEIF